MSGGRLLAFGFWSFGGALKYYVLIGGLLCCALTLVAMIGFVHEYERRGANVRILSGLFFALFVLVNAVFSVMDFSAVAYIILSGLGLLAFVGLANFVGSTRQ